MLFIMNVFFKLKKLGKKEKILASDNLCWYLRIKLQRDLNVKSENKTIKLLHVSKGECRRTS